MTPPPDLTVLSPAEKDTLIAALFERLGEALERIAVQDARIAALEARVNQLTRPPKTPGATRPNRLRKDRRPTFRSQVPIVRHAKAGLVWNK